MGVDTNDLRARARSRDLASLNGSSATARLLRTAADEIDALRAEAERLREERDDLAHRINRPRMLSRNYGVL